jgi:hypothetical protein
MEEERMRRSVSDEVNQRIDRKTEDNVARMADRDAEAVTDRLRELEREWDVERVLELNASLLALSGTALCLAGRRKAALLPLVVLGFLVQHAVQGWCPPLPLFRRLGVRTRAEVDQERMALKALRGDFDQGVLPVDPAADPAGALSAIRR